MKEITTKIPADDFEEIRIENTNHCGYKCFFCPREELTRDKGYMSVEQLELIVERIGPYQGKVDLHGFGEPLLDKSLAEKARVIKNRWPEASSRIISTLGVPLSDAMIDDIARSGLDTIEVSLYGVDEESYKTAHGVNKFERVKKNIERIMTRVRALGSDLQLVIREFPTHDEVTQPGYVESKKQTLAQWLHEQGVKVFRQNVIHNYGGGRAYNKPETKGVCSVAWGFRKRILQITWDLDVIPCCFDSNSTIKFGNLKDKSLAAIFAGEEYKRFIQAHIDNDIAEYEVCVKCERCFKP
ncbi:radical SAM protein [Thalassomonas viridans]|uniref:Radical SAM protein n=1 Tax=Thalassomonas viridans TaxID=137584 RepID=A0AAE9Z462_9GAMM|nr:radical SAM/SPASM domain-containing protein [Thalassomonas viridans]WDE05709.1 radical SAM protein [Thalassomonas viridans]